MSKLIIGLNGFGRIGRAFTRIALRKNLFDIGLINTRRTPNDIMAYLLQHDSVYRTFEQKVTSEVNGLRVGDIPIPTSLADSPADIPWGDHNVSIVVDATGAFTTSEKLKGHIHNSVKKVVLTAPSKDTETAYCVLGANDASFAFADATIVSNASCTTNCAALMFRVLHDHFGVERGFLTTAHAYTSAQSLLDDANKDETRSRAAGLSIIPTTTGAAKAVARVIPELTGKVDGLALRVPVPTGSFTDITAQISKSASIEDINRVFQEESQGRLKGLLAYESTPLVSSDYIGNEHSCIFDSNYTNVIGGTLVKITGWYDNEWGYSTRLVELVEKLGQHMYK